MTLEPPVWAVARLGRRPLCCPLGSIGTMTASDAHPARSPLPGVTVMGLGTPMVRFAHDRAREGLSSSRRHLLDVPRPIR